MDLVDEVMAVVSARSGEGGIFFKGSEHEIVFFDCVVHFPDFDPLGLVKPFGVLGYDDDT